MRRVVSGLTAAAVTAAVQKAAPADQHPQWERTSFQGSVVSLIGGLHASVGALAGALASSPARGAATVATLAGGVAGYIDDHLESVFPARGKGFRGHLGALREGKVTSGLLKIALIGSGSVGAAFLLGNERGVARLGQVAVDSLLIASTANLINLLDLRPGRALKSVVLVSIPALAGPAGSHAAGLLGTCAVVARDDLNGKTMLGDLGANALGAHVGVVIAASVPPQARAAILAGNVALTVASEKVSFSKVIESNRALRAIDSWGR